MKRRLLAVSLSLVVLLVFTGTPAHAQAFQIRAQRSGTAFVFSPVAPHVAVGRVVRWTAFSVTHTVTATSPNWSKNTTIAPGSSTTFRFRRAGTYRYRCTIHSSMVGRVIVP